MDRNTQTNLNTQPNRDALSDVFPDLKNDVNFEILSPRTPKYNCIAWAMQFEDRWVSIFDYPGYWWPEGVEKTMSPSALIHAFEAVGFTLCDNSNLEDGFDKVVLYKKRVMKNGHMRLELYQKQQNIVSLDHHSMAHTRIMFFVTQE